MFKLLIKPLKKHIEGFKKEGYYYSSDVYFEHKGKQ